MEITLPGSFRAIQYHFNRDIELLSGDERDALPKDHDYIDYTGWIYDWSWSRQQAYVRLSDGGGGYECEDVTIPDSWWIVARDNFRMIMPDHVFQKIAKTE